MENLGAVIRKHRIAKGLTQEELGSKVYVSKQAVSKWETGKAMPDIEMVRKLCNILEINNDEILGGSIEDARKNRKWVKICATISLISILIAIFFCLGGYDYIDRHTQSGVAYLSVFYEDKLLSTNEYQVISDLDFKDYSNGYKTDIDYGKIQGAILLQNKLEIKFDFFNTNNWHNIHIRMEVENEDNQILVKQTVTYETDNKIYKVDSSEYVIGEY